jgi:hypothetical protein
MLAVALELHDQTTLPISAPVEAQRLRRGRQRDEHEQPKRQRPDDDPVSARWAVAG